MKQIVSTVSSKGQVTIPNEVRRRLGVSTPDKVTFVIDDDGVHLKPTTQTLASLFGSIPPIPGRDPNDDFDTQIAEAMADEAERIVHGRESS